jgi:deoxycytidylate deaminase
MLLPEFLNACGPHKTLFRHAYTAALAGAGVGRNEIFRHGCIIAHGNRIVSAGFNSTKTHPMLKKLTPFPYLHAESHAIAKAGLDACNNARVYIVRVRSRGNIGLSKPCRVCSALLQEAKVKEVFYSTEEGYMKS